MPKTARNVKQPTDHQAKRATDEPDPEARFHFTRDGQEYTSLPLRDAMTVGLIADFPDPEQLSEYDQMRYSVCLLLSAFRDDQAAVRIIRRMTADEVTAIMDDVEDEQDLTVGESSGSSN